MVWKISVKLPSCLIILKMAQDGTSILVTDRKIIAVVKNCSR